MHPYEVLRRPVVTEKSMRLQDTENQYVFEVDRRANRLLVKQAVEERFDVKVLDVNIINMKAKTRRRSRNTLAIRVAPWKKAIVTLKRGDRIQVFEGV